MPDLRDECVEGTMEGYAHILRRIAEQLGCPPVKDIAAKPGIKAVYRVTVHYPDMHASDTVATLVHTGTGSAVLETLYRGHFNNRPLRRHLDMSDYQAFSRIFTPILFDRLSDQPGILFYGATLWLIERGAGSFAKGVIIAPQTATEVYSKLLDAVHAYLPEAVREIK
jgi:hypothetical protein